MGYNSKIRLIDPHRASFDSGTKGFVGPEEEQPAGSMPEQWALSTVLKAMSPAGDVDK